MKKFVLVLCLTALCLLCGCQKAPDHAHCVCTNAVPGHICAQTEWTALTQAMFTDATSDSKPVWLDKEDTIYRIADGDYYLAEDIVVSKQIVYTGTKAQLCINGKHMSAVNNRVCAVSGSTLKICDCQFGTEGYDGYIAGGNTEKGGAFLLQGREGGTNGELADLTLYSGVIKGGTTPEGSTGFGGAIWIYGGNLNIYGGQIIGGDIVGHGAAVAVDKGQGINVYGGQITGGKADFAPCVYLASGACVSLGGKVAVEDIYLEENCFINIPQELPLEDPSNSIGITMAVPGVFLKNIRADLADYFFSTDSAFVIGFDNTTKNQMLTPAES